MFYILSKIFIGGNNMVALYVALIIAGRRTFNQVPAKFKAAVDEILGIDLALPEALAQKAQLESKSVLMQPEYETLKNYILKELGL